MNIKLKALLIAIAILIGMFLFVYTLVFHPMFVMVFAGLGLVYLLYRLVLTALEEKEKWKNR